MNEQLRTEFNKRIKSLKLDNQAKEELFDKFKSCYDAGLNCFYCGNVMELKWGSELSFTWDHTIPRKAGGKNITKNIELVCRTCNFLKGDMSVEKYIQNMGRLIARKNKKEYWKAKKSSKKDEAIRDAYKDIFERRDANNA